MAIKILPKIALLNSNKGSIGKTTKYIEEIIELQKQLDFMAKKGYNCIKCN